jgi:putative transposase
MPYWKLYYHFVFGTKHRLPLIAPTLAPELYRVMAAKVQSLGGFVHAIGGVEDHAHLAASVPPKLAPAKFIGDVKGNSSHYVNHVIKPDFEWDKPHGYSYEARSSGLGGFSLLCTNSTVVYHCAGDIG